jgi:hypothetical protein
MMSSDDRKNRDDEEQIGDDAADNESDDMTLPRPEREEGGDYSSLRERGEGRRAEERESGRGAV